MMHARFIHLLLAALMATWSPAWCQCILQAAAAPAVAPSGDLADSATACCANELFNPSPSLSLDDACCPSAAETESPGCACCDRVLVASSTNDFVPPLLDHLACPAWMMPDDEAIGSRAVLSNALDRRCAATGPPRTDSLFARHCLLIV